MTKFILLLLILLGSISAWADHHFTEIYSDGEIWQVDHFKAADGELQTKVETRSFKYHQDAEAYARSVNTLNTTKKRFVFVSTEVKASSVWEVKNQWDEDWENKFSEWVSQNFEKSFFTKNNLATDCADVAYSLRWIFARNNYLPAAGTLAGSGLVVTQDTMKKEWENLSTHKEWSKDQRFLAALNWLLDNVYTKTLYQDTFPVEISQDTIKPGLINLMGGHTEIFYKVSTDPSEVPLELLSSTMPRAVRELSSRPFVDSSVTPETDGGLLRFRWPVKSGKWKLIEKADMPFYSMEQYSPTLCEDESRFAFCLFKKLGMSYRPDLILEKTQSGLLETLKMRDEIVRNGFAYCQTHDCAPGTQAWEDWSTPTRDGRLKNSFYAAWELSYNLELPEVFEKWLNTESVPSQPMKLEMLYKRLKNGFVSSDPRDTVEQRWAASHPAIFKTVKQQFLESQQKRGVAVEKASYCRTNKDECRNSKKLISEYSTIELDFKTRELIAQWMDFCETEKCQTEKAFEDQIEKIWFQSSTPWDDLERRNGVKPLDGHFLRARQVSEGGKNFIILNNKTLYHLKSRQVIDPPKNKLLVFDSFTRQFFLVNDQLISFFDEAFNPVAELPAQLSVETLQFYPLGKGKFLITGMDRGDSLPAPGSSTAGWILDCGLKTISEEMSVHRVTSKINYDAGFVIINGDENLMLKWEEGELVQETLPAFPGELFSVERISAKNILFTFEVEENDNYGSQVSVLKNGEFKRIDFYQNDRLQISVLDGGYVFFQSSYPGRSTLYDHNLEPVWSGLGSGNFYKLGNDKTLIFHYNQGTFRGFTLSDVGIEETGLTFSTLPYFMATTPEWISYYDTKNFGIKNFKGEEVERHPFIGKIRCHMTSICEGDKLLSEYFVGPLLQDDKYDLMEVGLARNYQLGRKLAQVITYRSDIGGPAPEYQEMIGAKSAKVGQGIFLHSKLMLWFPE